MPRHISLVFPGQGSQHIGMLENIDSCFIDEVKPIVNSALDFDLIDIINNGNSDDLNRTSITQPALLLASYLSYKQLKSSLDFHVNTICGHSLGEYSALVVGDALNLEQALQLVHQRGLLMEECDSGSMYAILNCDLDKIINYCEQVQNKLSLVVSPANINSPKQIVIAGDIDAVEEVILLLKNDGIRKCIKLKVSVPSHCKLMTPASIKFSEVLDKINFKEPKSKVVQNFSVTHTQDITAIKENLVSQLYSPVRWSEIMNFFESNSITEFYECGPSKVLTGLIKRQFTDVDLYSLDDFGTLNSIMDT